MDRSARAEPNTSRRARSGVPSRPPSVGAARPPPSSSASKVSERHPPSSTRVPSDDAPKTRASRVPSSASRAPASSGDPASASASASVTITPDALREACGGADPRVALACDLRNRRLASVPAPIASLLDAVATLDVSHNAIETLEGLAPMRRLRLRVRLLVLVHILAQHVRLHPQHLPRPRARRSRASSPSHAP